MHSFIKIYVVFFVTLLLVIAIAGLIVDPSGFFYYRGIYLGEKADKKTSTAQVFTKTLALSILSPQAVMIGTSRVDKGYNLISFNSIDLPDSLYNLGIPGMTMEEAAFLIGHLEDNHELTDLFLALDYGMFTTSRAVRQEFLGMKSSNDSKNSSFLEKMRLYKAVLFSPVVIKPLFMNTAATDTSGFRTYNESHLINTFGHRKITRSIEENMSRSQQNSNYPAQLESFQQAITILSDMPTRVHIFVNPVHVRSLILYAVTGKQQNYLQWLDDMIRIMCQHSAEQSLSHLSVFSGVNQITTERFPEIGDTETKMRWHWESTHFKPSAGTLVLQKLTDYESSVNDFGRELTCSNQSQFIAKFENEWNNYMVTHSEIVKEITGIVKRANTGSHTAVSLQMGASQ